PVWESGELSSFQPEVTLPAEVIAPDSTYRMRVRLKNQLGQWSHWSEAIEFRATADVAAYAGLMISELMYHPQDVTAEEASQGYVESDFEYLELWNRGGSTIDLTNLRFTKGIDFDLNMLETAELGAGDRVILVRNAAAFAQRYGVEITIGGSWGTDQLSNRGERLKLSLGGGAPVIDFSYGDSEPWPSAADGEGHALEFAGEGDPNDSTQWKVSKLGGSPGASDGETLTWLNTSLGEEEIVLEWRSSAGKRYQVETSKTLGDWESRNEIIEATAESSSVILTIPAAERDRGLFLRVVERP
ncbi:MAG: hypothetical protein ACKVHP_21060, partial [Verrucomicrobiales bacterium]